MIFLKCFNIEFFCLYFILYIFLKREIKVFLFNFLLFIMSFNEINMDVFVDASRVIGAGIATVGVAGAGVGIVQFSQDLF